MANKPEKTPTLLQAATAGARIIRQPQLVQFIVDGNGAMVAPILDWVAVEKWANARYGSGNRMADRSRFLDQLQVLVARPGSFISTRGSTKPLEDLCKLMKAGGYDLGEWQLPPELKDMGKPKPKEPPKKPSGVVEEGSPEGGEAKPAA